MSRRSRDRYQAWLRGKPLRHEVREGDGGEDGWLTSMTGTGDAFSLSRAWYFSRSACGRSSEKKSSLQAVAFFTKFLVIMLLQVITADSSDRCRGLTMFLAPFLNPLPNNAVHLDLHA